MGTVGSKTNMEIREQMEAQVEERRAPLLSKDDTGEQNCCDSVDVENLELRQTVAKLKSQMPDISNDSQELNVLMPIL
nr:hypothetical protein CFP56_18489 [Quercus suber]